ncbi:MAG: hypothetical protein RLZZ500_2515, partial [Bacteroidota bacterium]
CLVSQMLVLLVKTKVIKFLIVGGFSFLTNSLKKLLQQLN